MGSLYKIYESMKWISYVLKALFEIKDRNNFKAFPSILNKEIKILR